MPTRRSRTLRLLLLTISRRVGHLAVRLLRVRLHGPAVEADKGEEGGGRRGSEAACWWAGSVVLRPGVAGVDGR